MKKCTACVALVVVIILAVNLSAYAVDFGTPGSIRKKAKNGLDLGFFSEKSKFTPDDKTNWAEVPFTRSYLYAQFYHTFSEKSEVYLRLGGVRLKSERAFEFGSISFLEEQDAEFQTSLAAGKNELAILEQGKTIVQSQYDEQQAIIDTLSEDERTTADAAQEERIQQLQQYDENIEKKQTEISTLEGSLTALSQLQQSNGKDFDSNFKPFVTWGYKVLFLQLEDPQLDIGFFVQGTMYSNYYERHSELLGEERKEVAIEINYKSMWDIVTGLGAQTNFQDATFYGGLLAGLSNVNADSTITTPNVVTKRSTTYKNKNNIGLFFGLSVPVGQTFNINLEFEYRSDMSFGLSVRDTF